MSKARIKAASPPYQIGRDSLLLEYGSVNKAFLLTRGWTRTAIKRILGEPDRRIVRRGYRKNRPECRYDAARVLAAEKAGPIRFRRRRDEPEVQTVGEWKYCGYCRWRRVSSGIGRPRKYCSSWCRNRAVRERAKKIALVMQNSALVTTIV